MEDGVLGAELEHVSTEAVFAQDGVLQDTAAVGGPGRRYLFRYVGQVENGALHPRTYDKGTASLNAQQHAVGLQLAQGPPHGEAGCAEFASKVLFRGDLKVGRPFLRLDTAIDRALDLLV